MSSQGCDAPFHDSKAFSKSKYYPKSFRKNALNYSKSYSKRQPS